MNKFIHIIIFPLVISTISVAETCTGNPLQAKFEFEALSSPVSGSDLNYCKTLQEGNTCCNEDTINLFQADATALANRITNLVSERDKYLLLARKLLRRVTSRLKTFQSAAANAIVYLQNQPTPSVELQTATVVGAVLAGISSAITDQFSTFQANFTQMQKARSECISEMIQIQASAWCFGCDPNFGTTGIEGFDLVYSDDLKQRVIDKCIYYLTYSYNQNFIYILYYSSSALEALAPTLQQISTGNPQAVTEFIRIINTWEVNLSPKTTALTPIKFPTDCNATDCAWLFEELFVNGTLNEKLIAAGGVFVDNGGFSTTSRRLKEERDEEALDKKYS